MRSGVTPVPIPNTTVKTRTAESTILATVWEDRWLPDFKRNYLNIDHRAEVIQPVDDCSGSQKDVMFLQHEALAAECVPI